MKELILEPTNLLIILAIVSIYSYLGLNLLYGSRSTALKKFASPWMITTIILLFPVVIPPFSLANPQRFQLPNLSLTGLISTIIIQSFIFIPLKELCFKRFISNLRLLARARLIVILAGFVIASSLWSETPGLSLKTAIGFLQILILAAQFAGEFSWEVIEKILRQSLTWLVFISFGITIFLPFLRNGVDVWGGLVFSSKNFGQLSALTTVLWISYLLNSGIKRANLLPFGFFVVFSSAALTLASNAKAALVNLILLIYLTLSIKILREFKLSDSIVILILLTLGSTFLGYLALNSLPLIFDLLGKDPTLTGRTVFWSQLIDTITNSPLGFGYNGFWQPWRGDDNPALFIGSGSLQLGDYRPPHAHNGFFEVGLQLGFIGLLLFITLFGKLLFESFSYAIFTRGSATSFPLIIMAYLTISNLGETETLGLIGPNYTLFLFLLVALKLSSKSINHRSSITPIDFGLNHDSFLNGYH